FALGIYGDATGLGHVDKVGIALYITIFAGALRDNCPYSIGMIIFAHNSASLACYVNAITLVTIREDGNVIGSKRQIFRPHLGIGGKAPRGKDNAFARGKLVPRTIDSCGYPSHFSIVKQKLVHWHIFLQIHTCIEGRFKKAAAQRRAHGEASSAAKFTLVT